ncbi:MAG: hypothetical protein FJW20_03515 [Acidimicrobiia bacterium]|nr:hypothetical protein [Acidimicrobiia bacterium]
MASFAIPASPSAAAASLPQSASQAAAAEAQQNKEIFLKLLVAQLQNQNPTDPADPIQFVTQLAQFTGLEQTIAMRQELESIKALLEVATAPVAVPPATSPRLP